MGTFAFSDEKLKNEKDVACGLNFLAFLLSSSTGSIKNGAYGFLNYCSVRNRECTPGGFVTNGKNSLIGLDVVVPDV